MSIRRAHFVHLQLVHFPITIHHFSKCKCLSFFNCRIACVSCPTLYTKLVELKPLATDIFLFEFDRRFEKCGNFVFYDYREPLKLPDTIKEHSFDFVVADPPFLSEECLQKVSQTILYLTKERIMLCTGQPLGLFECI